MAKFRLFALLGLTIFFLVAPAPSNAAVAISFTYFHDELAPHGRWVTAAQYGDVWCPSGVAAGWEPYTNGQWVYTDYGWTWVSDDPWGGDPFHYGTWEMVGSYGWCWIPGYVWSPAWVTWSTSDDFIGWAPIPPTLQLEAGGYFGPPVVVERTRYVFVPVNRFVGTPVATVRVPPQQNAVILGRAHAVTRFQVASGIVRNEGPSARVIERATHSPIRKTSISAAHTRPVAISAVAKGRRISVVAPPQARVAEKARSAGKGRVADKAHPAGKAAPAHSARSTEKSRSTGAPAAKKAAPSGGERHVASGSRVEHRPAAHAAEARKAPKPASAESPAGSRAKQTRPAEPVRAERSARADHPPKRESAPPTKAASATRPSAPREPVAATAAPARPAPPREQVASREGSGRPPAQQPPPKRPSSERQAPPKEKEKPRGN